jgi:tetratricopeptide (TPR) repeat protein
MGPAMEHQAQLDLLDLAIIGSNLHVQLAGPGEKMAARLEARQMLDQAEAFFEPTAALYNERRQHALALGLIDEAKADQLAASRFPPKTAWEFYALGRSLLQGQEFEKASAALDRALAIEPGGLWPNFYQGVCCYRLGRFDDAALAFTACTALAPQAAVCFYNRALAFTRLGRTDRAIPDYDRALELDPDLVEAALNRGILHYQSKRLLEATTDLQRALKLGADPASAHYHLALVCLSQSDRAGARAHLENCQGAGPDQAKVTQLLQSLRK